MGTGDSTFAESTSTRVRFEIDNLDVLVGYDFPATTQRFMMTAAEATRIREDVLTLTKQVAGKLTPRNKTVRRSRPSRHRPDQLAGESGRAHPRLGRRRSSPKLEG